MNPSQRSFALNKFCKLKKASTQQENIYQLKQTEIKNQISEGIVQQQRRVSISETDLESDFEVLIDSLKSLNNEESLQNSTFVDFQNQYVLLTPILEDKIFKCKNISTGSIEVAKFFICDQFNQEYYKNLFQQFNQILKYQPHKNILWFDNFFLLNQKLIGITKLLEGGNLWEVFKSFEFKFSLQQIKIVMKALLKGLNHLHQNGIMHRDIKLSNIVFRDKQDLKSLKIIDFEFATFLSNPQYQDCGTEGYIAPEVRRKSNYNEKCDIYSAGVIFYILIFQKRLKEDDEILDISQIKYFTEEIHEYQVALDLLKQMLQKNPKIRINSEQCLKHEFFNKKDLKLKNKINKLGFIKFKNPFYKNKSI